MSDAQAESTRPDAVTKGRASHGGLGLKIALAVAALVLLVVLGRQAAAYLDDFVGWVESLGAWGPIVFIAGYAVGTVAFVPGSLLTMASGAIFGLFYGTLYVIAGSTIGVTCAFLIARFLARRQIEEKITGSERFAAIDRAIARRGGRIVFLLRLSPAFPYSLLNYALGLTKVPLLQYVLASVGMIPGTFLYVYYGKALGSLSAVVAGEEAQRGAEQWVFLGMGLAATIVVTIYVTKIARRALSEATDSPTLQETIDG